MKKTLVLKIDPENPDKKKILSGACAVKAGGLVAFPTETVYGIAANFKNKKAMIRLYETKRRPKNKPFTVHISSLKMIKKMRCSVTKEAKALIDRFWPGPLTIILKSSGGKRIGFRMPDNRVALELIEKSGVPVVAPSANISGFAPPKSPQEVLEQLDGKIDILLDAGRCAIGVESTVIDMTLSPPKILRKGALKEKEIFKIIENV